MYTIILLRRCWCSGLKDSARTRK